MEKKKFEILLIKNTFAIVLPAMAVFAVLIFMLFNYPVLEHVKCYNIGNIIDVDERLAMLYANGTTNVKYIAKNLYYTGFDYFVDEKREGSYYYSADNDQLLLFLVETKEPQMFIEQIELKGKIIKDSISVNHIMNKFAEQNGMESELLHNYCSEYIISEPDYPYSYIALVYIFMASPIIVCVLIFIYTVFVTVNPVLHPQVRQLEDFGEVGEVIKSLNDELMNNLRFHKNNIYVTDDYMIVTHISRIDIIRLDDVLYLSKNLVEEKKLIHFGKDVFRLTMSKPEVMFYEMDFTSEDLIDKVVEAIRGI